MAVLNFSFPSRQAQRNSGALNLILAAFLCAGCSDLHTPTTHEALTHPFGTAAPFARGTSKAKVLAEWGNPDHIVPLGTDELGNVREEWIYKGRIPSLPIDYEYVSRTKHLFFEGQNLIRWTTEEEGTGQQPVTS